MSDVKTCKECGGDNLSWEHSLKNIGPAENGRLNLSEVDTVYYLACNECSETLGIMSGEAVASILNDKLLDQQGI